MLSYAKHCRKTYTRKTYQNRASTLRRFFSMARRLPMDHLDSPLVKLYAERLESRGGVSFRYAQTLMKQLRRFAAYSQDQGWISIEALQRVRLVKIKRRTGESALYLKPRVRPVSVKTLDCYFEALADEMQNGRCNATKVRQMVIYLELLSVNFTLARPSELLGVRLDQIDRTAEVWTFKLPEHKNAHRDQERVLQFGPAAQQNIKLIEEAKSLGTSPWLFEKMSPRGVSLGERLTGGAVAKWFDRFQKKHSLPPFSLNQCRHFGITEVADQEGLAVAQHWAGHRSRATTEIYVEPTSSLSAAKRMG